jgi:hypothetical protein
MPLQDLDLVAVRILDEEEPGHQGAVAEELLDVERLQTLVLEAGMLGIEIVDREGDMAVAGAMLLRLSLALVPGQLDLEVILGIAQIDE